MINTILKGLLIELLSELLFPMPSKDDNDMMAAVLVKE